MPTTETSVKGEFDYFERGHYAKTFPRPIRWAVHPEVVGSGGHPACRRGRASCRPEQRLKRGG